MAETQKTPVQMNRRLAMLAGILAMTVVVTASNFLVEIQINDWLTWGAMTYPVSFLVTDLTNRTLGPAAARRMIYFGFVFAVILSTWLANPRIAFASGSAFLLAQLLDVYIFDRLRRAAWWRAPIVSSTAGSALDTALFFSLAFAGTAVPWVTLAIGDFGVKMAVAGAMLIPFRAFIAYSHMVYSARRSGT